MNVRVRVQVVVFLRIDFRVRYNINFLGNHYLYRIKNVCKIGNDIESESMKDSCLVTMKFIPSDLSVGLFL